MKIVILLMALLLVGCSGGPFDDRIWDASTCKVSNVWKASGGLIGYQCGTKNMRIYTKEKYHIGDTIKINFSKVKDK